MKRAAILAVLALVAGAPTGSAQEITILQTAAAALRAVIEDVAAPGTPVVVSRTILPAANGGPQWDDASHRALENGLGTRSVAAERATAGVVVCRQGDCTPTGEAVTVSLSMPRLTSTTARMMARIERRVSATAGVVTVPPAPLMVTIDLERTGENEWVVRNVEVVDPGAAAIRP